MVVWFYTFTAFCFCFAASEIFYVVLFPAWREFTQLPFLFFFFFFGFSYPGDSEPCNFSFQSPRFIVSWLFFLTLLSFVYLLQVMVLLLTSFFLYVCFLHIFHFSFILSSLVIAFFKPFPFSFSFLSFTAVLMFLMFSWPS